MNASITFEEAIKTFYDLKSKYAETIVREKKKIKDNASLTIQDKQREYHKFKPHCIHCKRLGGTIFHIQYIEEENNVPYREYNAYCGLLADPCNLNIKFQVGLYNLYQERLKELENSLMESKKELIDNKNMLLFDFITTEESLDNFQFEREFINEITSLYDKLLEKYMNKQVKPPTIKIEESYLLIEQIKECVKKFKQENSLDYLKDAVNIYNESLRPKLIEIQKEIYPISYVEYVPATNKYHLIQREPILEMTNMNPVIIKYDIAPYNKKSKKIRILETRENEE